MVEDVVADAELITITLEHYGLYFTADRVDSMNDCEHLLATCTYDLLLSDYRLPGWNAHHVLMLLQRSGQDIPLILVTGSLGEEAAVECIRSGMTDYVLKDRLFRLPHVIDRALEEFKSRRQRQQAIAQLAQQAHQETLINQIVQAMRDTLILSDVLQTTADRLHDALRVDRCWIFHCNDRPHMMAQYLSHGSANREMLLGSMLPLGVPYQNKLRRGESVTIFHPQSVPFLSLREFAQAYHVQSILIYPLMYQGVYLGGIGLHQCSGGRAWTSQDQTVLSTIAHQCAITIHQAQLYEQLQAELSEHKQVETQLRHDAFHDSLTGLPNRTLLLDRLEQSLRLAQSRHERHLNHPYQFAVLFLDLDRFKVINDSLGHGVGDLLLQSTAQRLSSSMRAGDTVARLGGDEFVLLIEDIKHVEEVVDVANRIHRLLSQPFQLEEHEVFVSATIGIALNTPEYQDSSQLLQAADTAMYAAKKAGRACYALFDDAMHEQAMRRLTLEQNLRRAFERQELCVYYQPVLCLQTGQIHGFEALVRWQHPTNGLLDPSEFMLAAEEMGLIMSMDLWVLQVACHQLQTWTEQFSACSTLHMSVNLSGLHFTHDHLPDQIQAIVEASTVPRHLLKIELTECALIQNSRSSKDILSQLQRSGLKICMDDFGTGYSSLSYLHTFPIDTLKIDRSCISRLGQGEDADSTDLIKTMVTLGLNLNLAVIAEGIETDAQCEWLRRMGCHYGQGYWFSPPLTAAGATQLLQEQRPMA